jgi:L-threonylcarbamoyladenylate synthase
MYSHPISQEQAIELLRQEEVVALPTETVYGLAARIDSETALKKIFATKARPFFDPLIVHVENASDAQTLWQEQPEIFIPLIEKFWPGPLTLIAPKKPSVSNLITSGLGTVAVRCPVHPVMRRILKAVGTPLAAPSANRFGKVSPTCAAHVVSEFTGTVPVVDGGSSVVGVESTVLTAELRNLQWTIRILRPGSITSDDIRNTLGDKIRVERSESVHAPGHLKVHYRPASPLIILENKDWSSALKESVEKKLGHEIFEVRTLVLNSDPALAARELYSQMRELSSEKKELVLIVQRSPQNTGFSAWDSIWDRLERASFMIL